MTEQEFKEGMATAIEKLENIDIIYDTGVCWGLWQGFSWSTPIKREFIALLAPDGPHPAYWLLLRNEHTRQETRDFRLTAMMLFEQVVLSEKTYLEF